MDNRVDVLTVRVVLTPDIQDFISYGSSLSGTARLVQGKTNIPIESRLGVMSLCDGKPFNIVFTNCSNTEIEKFKRFEYNEPGEYIGEDYDTSKVELVFDLED